MIKIEELRLLNWVNTSDGAPVQVTQINGLISVRPVRGCTGPYPSERLSPIMLTPEILEKCGFVESDSHTHEKRGLWSIQVANNTSLYFDATNPHDKQWYLSLDWNDNHYQNDFWNKPEYVHQLQNLYFSLTGNEIIYTP